MSRADLHVLREVPRGVILLPEPDDSSVRRGPFMQAHGVAHKGLAPPVRRAGGAASSSRQSSSLLGRWGGTRFSGCVCFFNLFFFLKLFSLLFCSICIAVSDDSRLRTPPHTNGRGSVIVGVQTSQSPLGEGLPPLNPLRFFSRRGSGETSRWAPLQSAAPFYWSPQSFWHFFGHGPICRHPQADSQPPPVRRGGHVFAVRVQPRRPPCGTPC